MSILTNERMAQAAPWRAWLTSRGPGTTVNTTGMSPPCELRRNHAASRLRRLHRQLAGGSHDAPHNVLSPAASAAAVSAPFSPAQVEAYVRDGACLISGLVPAAVVESAKAAMWRQMAGPSKPPAEDKWAAPDRARPLRDDRSTWPPRSWNGIVDGPESAALFTPAWLEAATAVTEAAADASPFPVAEHPIICPDRTLALHIFPTDGQPDDPASWSPHFDSFVRDGTSGWRTHPRPMVLQMICYLTGTGAVGEGGTVVWPGSHKRMDELYMSDPARFSSLEALVPHTIEQCEGIEPVGLRPVAGDVLFYDLFCGHGSSSNTSNEPRLATNHKFAIPFQQQTHLLVGVSNRH